MSDADQIAAQYISPSEQRDEAIKRFVATEETIRAEIEAIEVTGICLLQGFKAEVARSVVNDAKDQLIAMYALKGVAEGTHMIAPKEPTPNMIAAAWAVVRSRWPKGKFLGVGPAFKECMIAMIAASEK